VQIMLHAVGPAALVGMAEIRKALHYSTPQIAL
jgi:hypothetical protein